MNAFDLWLVRTFLGASLVLLVALLILRWVGQPAGRQRLGEFGLLAALSVGVLSLVQPAFFVFAWSDEDAEESPTHEPPIATPHAEFMPDADALLVWLDDGVADNAVNAVDEPYAPPMPIESEMHAISVPAWHRFRPWVIGMYTIGIVAFLLRWLLGIVSLQRLVRGSREASVKLRGVCLASWTRRGEPRVLISDRLEVPISFGVVRPTVLIPASLVAANRPAEVQWVLRHEFTHLKRRDAWSNGLFMIGQAVFFPLPWFHWLRRQVRLCQEYVADAEASQHGNVEDYAEFLLRFTARPAAAALVSAASGSDLTRRITMLLKTTKTTDKRGVRWQLTLGALALAALAIGAAGISAQDKEKQEKGLHFQIQLAPDGTAKDVLWQIDAPKPAETKEKTQAAVIQSLEKVLKQLQGPADQLDLKEVRKEIARTLAAMKGPEPKELREVHLQIERLLGQIGGTKGELGAPKVILFKTKGSEELQKAVEKMIKEGKFDKEALDRELAKLHPGAHTFNRALPTPTFDLEFDLGNRFAQPRPKLGVSVEAPSDVLAEQLNLAKGKGLLVIGVAPESPAEKAGIKINDVLLKVAGKEVPSEMEGLQKIVEGLKGEIDVVLMRRGKQETVKGIKLAVAAPAPMLIEGRPIVRPLPPTPPVPPTPPAVALPPLGSFRLHALLGPGGDAFSSVLHQGNMKITVTGHGKGKNLKVERIVIEEGNSRGEFDAVDKVPEAHRARVEQMIETGRK